MCKDSGCVVSKFGSLSMPYLKLVSLPHIASHPQEILSMSYIVYKHTPQVLQAFLDSSMHELKPEIKLNLSHNCITWMHCLIVPSNLTGSMIYFTEVLYTCILTVQHDLSLLLFVQNLSMLMDKTQISIHQSLC